MTRSRSTRARLAQERLAAREYAALAKFSSRADLIGVKTTAINKGPLNRGCHLKLSGRADYEVTVHGDALMLLARVEAPGERRIKLYEGGSGPERSGKSLWRPSGTANERN